MVSLVNSVLVLDSSWLMIVVMDLLIIPRCGMSISPKNTPKAVSFGLLSGDIWMLSIVDDVVWACKAIMNFTMAISPSVVLSVTDLMLLIGLVLVTASNTLDI